MGYRSDLVIAVDRNLRVEAMLLNTWPKLLSKDPKKSTSDTLYYEIDGIKWYDTYEEVEELIKFMSDHSDLMPPNPDKIAGIRLGEDLDDFEYFGNPWDFDLTITRYINY